MADRTVSNVIPPQFHTPSKYTLRGWTELHCPQKLLATTLWQWCDWQKRVKCLLVIAFCYHHPWWKAV